MNRKDELDAWRYAINIYDQHVTPETERLKQVAKDWLLRGYKNPKQAKLMEAEELGRWEKEFTVDPIKRCWVAFNHEAGLLQEFKSLDLCLAWLFGELTLNGHKVKVTYNEKHQHNLFLKDTDWNAERVSGRCMETDMIRQIGYDEVLAVSIL